MKSFVLTAIAAVSFSAFAASVATVHVVSGQDGSVMIPTAVSEAIARNFSGVTLAF